MKKATGRKLIITLVLAAVIIIAAALAWAGSKTGDAIAEQTASIRDTVRARALQCYIIEGAYPESLDYLIDNYGLAVNTDDYRIIYIPYAENLPPEVKVVYLKDK